MVRIEQVYPGGIAEELGLEPGDELVSVNQHPVQDLIDLLLYESGEELDLEVRRRDGQIWALELEKDAAEPLGMELEHPEPEQCGNQCVFCFVHQLPKGMRRSLYIKDEDYRFSYLYGAYITLGNIGEPELARIEEQQLSPLYISVHATDEVVRCKLLGKLVPPIMPILRRMIAAGIQLHTQIVLCPEINDGECLEKTIKDLAELGSGVLSLAVVPVGLTAHRERLYPLRSLSVAEARDALTVVERFQERFLVEMERRFVFAADELYLQAGRSFPALEGYEDLPQIENGVGLVPAFREEARQVLNVAEPLPLKRVSLVTGESFATELQHFADNLAEKTGVDLQVCVVKNRFFGGAVSVAGLLTGNDIVETLAGEELGQGVLLPDVMFREGQDVFLDELSLAELQLRLKVAVHKVNSSPWGILDALEDLADTVSR